MTSQGQRFRRRALRRGYKVDEVDTFLDRVEATLAGEQLGAPVSAQEVHDVVFRVRFGGYDEWQVDLHLDRVERQLAELEERGAMRGPDPRMAPEPVRGGMPPMGAPMNRGAPPTERLPAPMRDDRGMRDEFGMREGMRDDFGMRDDRPMGPPPMQQRPPMPPPDPYGGRYEEPGYGPPPRGGYKQQPAAYDQGPGYDEYEAGYDGFEPGRHGKADMTAEIRLPDRGYGGPPPMPSGPAPHSPMGNPYGPPMGGPPMGGGPQMGSGPQMPGGPGGQYAGPAGPPIMGAPGPGPKGQLYRVDQLRRTFQPRRFGSGYDPMQVDRLFEGILQAMTGRGPMPVPENDLDMLQFGLVPGGYFEAEVDAALREVKDILLHRR